MSKLTVWMDEALYPKFTKNWDDVLFRERLLKLIDKDKVCLDYGAGRGNVSQMNFRGIAKHIAGIDPEPAVHRNPYLDEAAVLDLSTCKIPFNDATFDVVFADNVMEHVDEPNVVLKEINRVLKPGGRFLAKTPNKWHYMPIIARATPTWFHRAYNRMRGRAALDTFPTRYRCNTERTVRRLAQANGFSVDKVDLIEGRPEYLRMFAATYLLGWLWERTVNSTSLLKPVRCVLVFELQRT